MSSDPTELGRGIFGYRRSAVNQIIADRDLMLRQAEGRVRQAEGKVAELEAELAAMRERNTRIDEQMERLRGHVSTRTGVGVTPSSGALGTEAAGEPPALDRWMDEEQDPPPELAQELDGSMGPGPELFGEAEPEWGAFGSPADDPASTPWLKEASQTGPGVSEVGEIELRPAHPHHVVDRPEDHDEPDEFGATAELRDLSLETEGFGAMGEVFEQFDDEGDPEGDGIRGEQEMHGPAGEGVPELRWLTDTAAGDARAQEATVPWVDPADAPWERRSWSEDGPAPEGGDLPSPYDQPADPEIPRAGVQDEPAHAVEDPVSAATAAAAEEPSHSRETTDITNRFLTEEIAGILVAAEESAARIIERARTTTQHQIAQSNRLWGEVQAELGRFAEWRETVEPVMHAIQDKVDGVREEIEQVPERIRQALASMADSMSSVDADLAELLSQWTPPLLLAPHGLGSEEGAEPLEEGSGDEEPGTDVPGQLHAG